MLSITKLILGCLFIIGMIAASACLGPSAQDTSGAEDPPIRGSFGYRFDPEQQVVRGVDDEPTSSDGAASDITSPGPNRGNGIGVPTPDSRSSVPGENGVIGLVEEPEERSPIATPMPYPEEWLTQSPERGLLDSPTRVLMMAILLVIGIIAVFGVVRGW